MAEQHLYGSSRLGYTELNRLIDSVELNTPGYNSDQSFDVQTWAATTAAPLPYPFDYNWGGDWNLLNGVGVTRGYKRYELSNHLGNVLVVIQDRHLAVNDGGTPLADYFQAYIQSMQDYWPFGSSLPGREFKVSGYRYGFNNHEKDLEMAETYAFEYRIHDARLGRFLSVDPLWKKYPTISAFVFANNSPLAIMDGDGRDIIFSNFFIQTRYHFLVTRMIVNGSLLVSKEFENFNSAHNHLYLNTVDNDKTENTITWSSIDNLTKAPANTDVDNPPINSNSSTVVTDITFNQFASFYQQTEDGTWYQFNDLGLAVNIIHELYFHSKFAITSHHLHVNELANSMLALQDFSLKELNTSLNDEVAAALMLAGVLPQITDESFRTDLLQGVNVRFGLSLTEEIVQDIYKINAGNYLTEAPDETAIENAYLTGDKNYTTDPKNIGSKDGVVKKQIPQVNLSNECER